MTSKKTQSAANLERFKSWLLEIEETDQIETFGRVRQGVYTLNRTKAAETCGFARSAFSTNPDFVKIVETFEAKHALNLSFIEQKTSTPSIQSKTSQSNLDAKDKEIALLRRRLHAKSVEAEKLREELRQSKTLFDAVIPAGLPFPGKKP